jgi:hypothetical protein
VFLDITCYSQLVNGSEIRNSTFYVHPVSLTHTLRNLGTNQQSTAHVCTYIANLHQRTSRKFGRIYWRYLLIAILTMLKLGTFTADFSPMTKDSASIARTRFRSFDLKLRLFGSSALTCQLNSQTMHITQVNNADTTFLKQIYFLLTYTNTLAYYQVCVVIVNAHSIKSFSQILKIKIFYYHH